MTESRTEPRAGPADDAVVAYVTARAGLAFGGARETLLREALAEAVRTDATLANPPLASAAFARLCDTVTVRESFFFREPGKLALLRECLRDPARGHRAAPMRVWSAGCACGEEAYTLATVLHDAGLAGRYTVLGTDLSSAAVDAARTGVYGPWSLRGLDAATVQRVFRTHAERFQVREHLRGGVEFRQHNLLEPLPRDAGTFDVVFCRNVLIYLTPDAVLRAADVLTSALKAGGWLVTGVADPLLDGIEGLDTVVTDHGLAYRRAGGESARTAWMAPAPAQTAPAQTAPARTAPDRTAPDPVPAPVPEPDLASLVAEAARALDRARPLHAERLARRALADAPRLRPAHRLLVLALAQRGMLADALAAAAAATAAFPAAADVHQLHAVVLLESGDVAGAAQAATRAVRLDPELVPAQLLLARTHELLGDEHQARLARRRGRRLLAVDGGSP